MCTKKDIDMVTIDPKKANAQSLTCFITFIATAVIAVILMIVACINPIITTTTTEITCWISMALEAVAIGLGFIAYWIKKHTL